MGVVLSCSLEVGIEKTTYPSNGGCGSGRCLDCSRLADAGVVKTGNRRVPSLVKKKIPLVNGRFFLFSGTNVFNGIFF